MSQPSEREDPLQFASLIAHQIRSPIGAADSILKTVLAGYAGHLSGRQEDLLAKVDGRLEQALNTVRRMLAILRPETAEGPGGTTCDAAAVLRRRQSRHSDEANARRVTMTLDISLDPAPVRVGEAALSEALEALLTNALKYTPSHGEVRLRITAHPEDDSLARIAIADSGIGIPEEERQRVFKPFYRTATARDTALPGSGLGLAFVQALVERAGGSVAIERADLGGAELLLDLPRARADELAGAEASDGVAKLRVVVIGGVAAGPKVASKINRLDPDVAVTIVERGDLLSYSGCGLPYYVSGVVHDESHLMANPLGAARDPVFFRNVKNVRVLNRAEALEIDRAGKRVRVRRSERDEEFWLPYDKLVLATGSSPLLPPIAVPDLKGIYTLHGMHDAEGIRAQLDRGKARDVVIVGGGLIGVEMTEALVLRGCRVTIVEKRPRILLGIFDPEMSALLERDMEASGVRVLTSTEVLGFEGEDAVSGVETDAGTLSADLVLLAVGVRPNVDLARRAEIELGETGAIRVDERMRTADPDVYAVGDCVETRHLITAEACYMPLGSTANKQGRVAAVNLCDGEDSFAGVLGSCVCKVFDNCVARTGLTEHEARQAGYDVVTVLLPSLDREPYMPDAGYLRIKLVVDSASRRLLGAQCLGAGHGDKRIDVVATALTASMTVDQVASLDLCYAPPYSLALDNLHAAANVARNKLAGLFRGISPLEVHRKLEAREEILLLDVSSPREHEALRIPGSVAIALGSLHSRLAELDPSREVVVYCRTSLRAYEAALLLEAAGFAGVRVLDGGVEMWPFETVRGRR